MDAKQELERRIIEAIAVSGFCDEALQQQLKAILGDYTVQKQQESTSADLQARIEHFLSAKKIEGLSYRTLGNYKLYLTRFSLQIRKDTAAITTDDVRSYLGALKLKDSSLQTVINTLRSFFRWLEVEEIIDRNPMLKIRTPRKHRNAVRKSLTFEELERLRNACTSIREKALVEFFYSTGCRLSEVAGTRLADIDFSRRTARVLGKGGKERIVYFSIKAKLLLDEYMKQRPTGADGLFVNSRAPYAPIHTRTMQNIIHDIGVRAKLPERVYPHLLRHTFATLALNNGMEITIIQKLLGHSQLSTTEIYAFVDMENARQSYDRAVS